MKTSILLLGFLVVGLTLRESVNAAPAGWANDLSPITAKDWNFARAAHLLERAAFGGTPEEIAKLARMTPADAVNCLVDYQKIDDRSLPAFEHSGIYPNGHKLASLGEVAKDVFATGKAYGVPAAREGKLPFQPAINEFYTLLFSEHAEMLRAGLWWANRMLVTPRPVQEKLTLFWHDHFATSQEKVANHELMLGQIETLRRHANGNFRDLLVALAQDPAMLIWLDNRENVKGRPNENFAREIMELFCMGEGQGYSESDIRELARAFTGWTLRPIKTTNDAARFVADPKLHDDGVKTFLGETGRFNGYDAIDIILKQRATPRFITRKLYREFVREEITPELNERLARLLVESHYELKPVLNTIFLSRDFYSAPSIGTQVKPPIQFLVSTWHKLGLRGAPGIPDFTETAGGLGQVLFYPPNVAGWPGGRSWINPATLLARGNYIHTLLFPDPARYVPPDKVVLEGYRQIPELFPQYEIQPHLWNPKTGRMEPVSMREYRKFLAQLDAGPMKAKGIDEAPMLSSNAIMASPGEGKSKMSQMADTEWFNLAVGVYSGIVEAFNRVKPVPRIPAKVDFVAMARSAQVATVEEAVDYFCRRFLSVNLASDRRASIVEFLRSELNSARLNYDDGSLSIALRRVVHLILSAPEYQLG